MAASSGANWSSFNEMVLVRNCHSLMELCVKAAYVALGSVLAMTDSVLI